MNKLLNSLRYIRWLAVTIFVGILLVVTFVVIVDPYSQYRFYEYPGFNTVKPALARYQNEIKLTQALQLKPNAFILGNSRAEIGFDPDAPNFNQHGLEAYNLAIPGIGVRTTHQQLSYLTQHGIEPKFILLGLEFLDFVVSPQFQQDSPPKPQHTAYQKKGIDDWFWKFDSLFSLASVKDSFRTLFIQNDDEAEIMTSRGFNPLQQYKKIARTEGYYKLFRQRAEENTKIYLTKAKGVISREDFDHLHTIFDIASRYNSEINLIIYPYHAQILALFEETNLWPIFTEWKSLLINEISAAKQHHPNLQIILHDFSGYNHYNCERIPPLGDRETSTKWYWEAGHFKKELGDIILEQIFRMRDSMSKIGGDIDGFQTPFGFKLNESTFLSNQLRIAAERSDCIHNYPELFAEVVSLTHTWTSTFLQSLQSMISRR